MSEAELHVLRARLRGGIINKARRGELEMRLPIGFVYDAEGNVRLDPDISIQERICSRSHYPSHAWMLRQTPETVVKEISRLLDDYTEGEIADLLNGKGMILGRIARAGVGARRTDAIRRQPDRGNHDYQKEKSKVPLPMPHITSLMLPWLQARRSSPTQSAACSRSFTNDR
jgi:hypothetical protein